MKKDDLEPSYTFTVKGADGNAIDLTNATSVTFVAKATIGTKTFSGACTVTTASSGLCKYTFSSGDTDTTGIYNFEVKIIWPTNRPQRVPNDTYNALIIYANLS
jgi:hypothetical protein